MAAGITTCQVLAQLAAGGTLHTDCWPVLQPPLLSSRPRAKCLHPPLQTVRRLPHHAAAHLLHGLEHLDLLIADVLSVQ